MDRPPNYDQMSKTEQERQGVHVEMPRGFAQPGHVLKLRKSLCGLKQSPCNFFDHLKGKLEQAGFQQAHKVNPCLFISNEVICLTCVDDCIMVAQVFKCIDEILKCLRELQMEMTEEDDVAGFLGVHVERTDNCIKLTQKGLTQRITDALQIQDPPAVSTPVSYTHLTLPTTSRV